MSEPLRTTCCIVGGGPAGMMLGLLLARAGVQVTVLEKHGDFLRDFRGDTIHASTLELMHELGLLDAFLQLPHQKIVQPTLWIDGREFAGPDLRVLPTHCKFIALLPQWDFLNFIAREGARYPGFTLLMRTRATELLHEGGRCVGVRAERSGEAGGATEAGTEPLEIRADLVVATDGRHSTLREAAGLAVDEIGVPIDVLWFRVSTGSDAGAPSLGRIKNGKLLVTLPRGDYFQCAYIIRKGSFDALKAEGLESFHRTLVDIAPYLANVSRDISSWGQVFLLSVQINRLPQWSQPGLLCIGDAAHAMSPVGGIGINMAIQDAVATANMLWQPLLDGTVSSEHLWAIQKRRQWAVRATQAMQQRVHLQIERARTLSLLAIPWWQRQLIAIAAPLLRRLAARFIGVGLRPEHVRTPLRTDSR